MKDAAPSFRKALLRAAADAHRDGKITAWDLSKIRIATIFRPRAVREMQEHVTDQAEALGLMQASQGDEAGFDWMALLEFIKQLLPVILQIISLF